MRMLIERGVPASYTDVLSQTVLYYAAREGKLKCLNLLLENSMRPWLSSSIECNPNHRDQYGQTPLYYASR
jgi:ankyrin repeat protein